MLLVAVMILQQRIMLLLLLVRPSITERLLVKTRVLTHVESTRAWCV